MPGVNWTCVRAGRVDVVEHDEVRSFGPEATAREPLSAMAAMLSMALVKTDRIWGAAGLVTSIRATRSPFTSPTRTCEPSREMAPIPPRTVATVPFKMGEAGLEMS